MIPLPDERPAFDPAIQTEDIAFKSGEMIDCKGCSRTNPPNRAHCIYCGKELEIATDGAIKLNLRRLEPYEHGFNVVLLSASTANNRARVADVLSRERSSVEAILNAAVPLPLARVESERDAAMLQKRLSDLGINSRIVADDDLRVEAPPVRLSKIAFGDRSLALTDFNTAETTNVQNDDLVLLVMGSINRSHVDALEKKRRRGKEVKVINETTTSSDEMVLDLYSRQDRIGFRVNLTGFDFSCVGDNKSMLAGENMRFLIDLLLGTCPNAKLVVDYDALQAELGEVWEIESRKDTKGLMRIGVGKHEFGSVTSTSNVGQFTKYSRLQWHLL